MTYRQAPEFAFPAATEDIAAVYRELLKTYRPEDIGIFGCSAGGSLTAQSMAWFLKENLPLPGAIESSVLRLIKANGARVWRIQPLLRAPIPGAAAAN